MTYKPSTDHKIDRDTECVLRLNRDSLFQVHSQLQSVKYFAFKMEFHLALFSVCNSSYQHNTWASLQTTFSFQFLKMDFQATTLWDSIPPKYISTPPAGTHAVLMAHFQVAATSITLASVWLGVLSIILFTSSKWTDVVLKKNPSFRVLVGRKRSLCPTGTLALAYVFLSCIFLRLFCLY